MYDDYFNCDNMEAFHRCSTCKAGESKYAGTYQPTPLWTALSKVIARAAAPQLTRHLEEYRLIL